MKHGKSKSARRVVVTVPAGILQDIDRLADLGEMTRDELIVEAVKRFLKTRGPFNTAAETITSLKGELRKRPKVTKAISESTKDFKTGRYEEP